MAREIKSKELILRCPRISDVNMLKIIKLSRRLVKQGRSSLYRIKDDNAKLRESKA